MASGLLIAFWAISLMFVVTPGADWAFAITAGMHRGAARPAIAGLLLGHLAATIMVAAGVGLLVATNPFAMMTLTIFGAGYLLWLGFDLLIRPPMPGPAGAIATRSPAMWVGKGLGVSGLNPKVLLLFLALLPQFVDASGVWPASVQMLALGAVHIVNCGMIYALVAAGSGRVLRTRPLAAMAIGRISGAIMIGLALYVLTDQFI